MNGHTIKKVLSANDTGETGGHQAGILVPKDRQILSFFPPLNSTTKNPRISLDVQDDAGGIWIFVFIYYNNRLVGGTRNEFRLTGMTKYFRRFNLKAGDSVFFRRLSNDQYAISFQRSTKKTTAIKLTTRWKVIDSNELAYS
jgi:Restriction endonuclease EcoRII, N-terminal